MTSFAIALSSYAASGIQTTRDYAVQDWFSGIFFITGMIFLFGVLPIVVVFLVLPTLVAKKLPIEHSHGHPRDLFGRSSHPGLVGGSVGAVVGLALILAVLIPWSPAHPWVMHIRGGVTAVVLATLILILPLISTVLFVSWFRHHQHH